MNPIDKAKNVAKFQAPFTTIGEFAQSWRQKAKTQKNNGWEGQYKDLSPEYRNAVYDLGIALNYRPEEIEEMFNSGRMDAAIKARYKDTPSARVRQNDSPTAYQSEKLEDAMNRAMYNSSNRVLPNMRYAIPYIEELEIKIPGVGRTTTNALDSLAKYAPMAGIPLEEALGIGAQETAFGALPQYNYAEIKGNEEQKQKARDFNRQLGNASYFRNYGIIPAENFVRDFAYNMVEDPVDRDVPPLLHAFKYWKKGMYNRNDPNHTEDVRNKGKAVMATAAIQEWIKSSPFAQMAIQQQ